MNKRWLLLLPAALLLAPLAHWVWLVNYGELKARQTILEYRVPSGFSGWITIKYGVPGAPPIPFAPRGLGGTYTSRFPPRATSRPARRCSASATPPATSGTTAAERC